MKSKKNLILLGMMGSGKSTIGSLISNKLNLRFVDIDKLIEIELKSKISQIFFNKGEKFFREFEEKITLKTLKLSSCIISIGGGAFLNRRIRNEIINNDNASFWLNWDPVTLIKRIKKSSKRPLAINSTETDLLELIKKRSKTYRKANYKINCNSLSKNEIIKKIINLYETNYIKNKY